jgi:hypothetical protein
MIMEAMRLSLVDHEEHQRREAERRRNEGTSAEGDPPPPASAIQALESPLSTPLPASHSSSHAQSVNASPVVTLPIQPEASISTAHANVRNSETIPSANPVATIRTVNGANMPGLPPFSTLRAAMPTASTASAVLGNGNIITNRPPEMSRDGEAESSGSTTNTNLEATETTQPLGSHLADMPRISQDAFSTDAAPHGSQEFGPPEQGLSPESEFSREPLLGGGTSNEEVPGGSSVG